MNDTEAAVESGPQGFLVKVQGSDAIYLQEGDELYHLEKPEVAGVNGYDLGMVVTLSPGSIEVSRAKPLSNLTPSRFSEKRDAIRQSALNPLLKPGMVGAEIGAGAFPHPLPDGVDCVYFDKRTVEELQRYFPGRAIDIGPKLRPIETLGTHEAVFDFLIAHHCLEHTTNPVGVLMEWARTVKPGGLLCISVPDAEMTHDRGRMKPDLEHLILDHVLRRDGSDFGSREHIYSFILGWRNDAFFGPHDKNGLAELARVSVESEENDLHWHAYDLGILECVMQLAGAFGGFQPEVLARSCPRDYPHFDMLNDALMVFRKGPALEGQAHVRTDIRMALADMRERLLAAVELIPRDM